MVNMKSLLAVFVLVILDTLCLQGQNPFTFPLVDSSEDSRGFQEDGGKWIESVDERTRFSAKWINDKGGVRVEFSHSPIHYRNAANQKWQRINPSAVEHSKGVFVADAQEYPIALVGDGRYKTACTDPEKAVGFKTIFMNGVTPSSKIKQINEQNFVEVDIIPGVDKFYEFGMNTMKTYFTLKQAPVLNKSYFSWTEEILVPSDAHIERDKEHGYEEDGWWYGNLKVVDLKGEVISYIVGTWCVDASRNLERTGYRIYNAARDVFYLETKISSDYLNNATYPVEIDPLVTGPTAAWGDLNMPSCFIPEYHTDSILVTIPGLITVTDFFVTASFYADPFTTAIMADGSMKFSTSCDTSQTFEVQPPNGDLPGTAYLEAFDLRNPLLCCFNPLCVDTSFYLTMHLGRYTPGDDCNQTYIYYTPFTQWPFTAYIEGHTVESYGPQWTVNSDPICSNTCEFEGKARIKYGVPPYTLSHPWMDGTVVIGEPAPCDLGNTVVDLLLEWPGCPQYCPEPFSMDVLPPLIVDACNNPIVGMPTEVLNIKAAPSIEDPSPVEVCSESGETLTFESCAPVDEIYWFGNGTNGQGPVPLDIANNSDEVDTYNYDAFVFWNGCSSDTLTFEVDVFPAPSADFNFNPNPVIQGASATFTSNGNSSADPIISWQWTADGLMPQFGSQTNYAFGDLNIHEVCLEITTANDCVAEVCKDVMVIAGAISAPNIFTPNLDGLNDVLEFPNLDFFPSNHLMVWNRWGNLVLDRENYKNNWDGGDLPGGTYYYILDVELLGEQSGYIFIER